MTGLYEVWWNSAAFALAVALDDSVEFFLTDVHDYKLNADKKVCISRSYQMSCTKHKKKSQQHCHWKDLTGYFFLIYFMMFSWHNPTLSHISSRACCQLCYEQHFCLLQWNRLGTGWPWIARLTGKGYFQDSGKSHSCLQNVIKDSQINTSENVPFLRGEEENEMSKSYNCY